MCTKFLISRYDGYSQELFGIVNSPVKNDLTKFLNRLEVSSDIFLHSKNVTI